MLNFYLNMCYVQYYSENFDSVSFLNYYAFTVSMGKYNSARLKKYKYGILGIYIADLRNLQKCNIPVFFETHAGYLREALPFFPEEERSKYQQILEAGLSRVQFLRASQIVNALKEGEQSRKKAIDDFLTETD